MVMLHANLNASTDCACFVVLLVIEVVLREIVCIRSGCGQQGRSTFPLEGEYARYDMGSHIGAKPSRGSKCGSLGNTGNRVRSGPHTFLLGVTWRRPESQGARGLGNGIGLVRDCVCRHRPSEIRV